MFTLSPCQSIGQIDWNAWSTFRAWRTLALGFQCIDFCLNTSFGTPGGTESFNMVGITDKSAVSEENQIPVPEDKLK